MNKEEAIKQLDDLCGGDTEGDHSSADIIILRFLKENGHKEIAEAWERVETRAGGFWYA